MSLPRPAWDTKHLNPLTYRLWPLDVVVTLKQDDSLSDSTGRTLWLSAQILSVYLICQYGDIQGKGKRKAIELGAGTGLVSATLAALGFNALATDVPAVIESVTAPNAASAASAGAGYHVQALDWHDALSDRTPSSQDESRRIVEDEYDVILTADTVYSPALNRPLVSTLRRLARRGPGRPPPTTLVALERRDPLLVEQFFALASEAFACERVDPGKIKEMVSGLGWSEDDWDGVEIWSLRLRDAMQDG